MSAMYICLVIIYCCNVLLSSYLPISIVLDKWQNENALKVCGKTHILHILRSRHFTFFSRELLQYFLPGVYDKIVIKVTVLFELD